MRTAQATLVLAWALLPGGCGDRPRAPELRDDPVYQNHREGLRFLAPEGWSQTQRGEVPPGKADKERTLVSYRSSTGAGASLRVSLIDLPPSADLAAYLAGPSYSAKEWRQTAKPEEAAVGSVPGTRYAFSGRVDRADMTKEVVAVRRGERVYFFTALFEPKDTKVRDELRRVVASVIWKQ